MEPSKFNGALMAAILAAAIGIFALGAVQLWVESDESGAAKDTVQDIGNAWMPRADEVGPYSGKETVMGLAWLGSWLILHFALRNRHLDPKPYFGLALILVLVGVLGVWPPVWHFLFG